MPLLCCKLNGRLFQAPCPLLLASMDGLLDLLDLLETIRTLGLDTGFFHAESAPKQPSLDGEIHLNSLCACPLTTWVRRDLAASQLTPAPAAALSLRMRGGTLYAASPFIADLRGLYLEHGQVAHASSAATTFRPPLSIILCLMSGVRPMVGMSMSKRRIEDDASHRTETGETFAAASISGCLVSTCACAG